MRGKEIALEFLQKIHGKYVTNSHDRIMIQANLLKRAITHANIPPWVTRICPYAFSGFENLERVNVPNLVLAIDEEAFSKCPKLSVVNIPDSVKGDNLGKGAFRNCTSLACIRLPLNLSVVIEGSIDGEKWKILDTRRDVKSPNKKSVTCTFEIQEKLEGNEFYQFLRIRQTGLNAANYNKLGFSCLEFFGSII